MKNSKLIKRIIAGLSSFALATTMLASLPVFAEDYIEGYQYYSTLDPNGDEYQKWKAEITESLESNSEKSMLKSALKNSTIIANDYIEFNTTQYGLYTIGTTGGNPNSTTDDNKKMLYGHPGGSTSKTTINVGGKINQFTSSNVTYDADGSKSVSKASYDGVVVTQELSIIENSATGREDVVQIKYIVKNDTEFEKQVGIRIMMDTMLGSNDAAPFRVNGSDVTTETEYTGANIPQIWQAFDSAINPGVVAQGTFYKSGDRKPEDSFVVAGIMVSEGTIVSVNTQNKTVTVNDTTYRFRNINPITLNEDDISLKSKNVYNDTTTDTIAARIKLTNLSDKEIDINDLEIVYLYDNDNNTNEIFECDWAGLDNVTINSSVISNISYDEDLECSKITLSFSQVENSILPENADLDVHFRVHTINWDNYDVSNDYSLNGGDYSENDRILVYYNGILVNGNVE